MVMLPYDERRDKLLKTAAEVFADKGYHPTTMRDLSRATGLSLAGIYHYVQSKDELLYLIQRQCFERVRQGAASALDGVTGPAERIRAFILHHVTFFARHMSEMKVLSHEAGSLTGDRDAEIVALKRDYFGLLAGEITRLGRGRDARISAYALFGMMNWIYTWYHPDGPVSAEALAARFSEIFLQGI
ncbi:MAG TPA: TetR/AcrR family transcriptional regulator [Gemmatimonadales bacterium]